jgi:hypothetical protein
MKRNHPSDLKALGEGICEVAGFQVTCTRDCEILSEELKDFDARFPVSVSTLRRFFRLIPMKGNFSTTTLNSLARYAGFSSFRDFLERSKSANRPRPTASVETTPQSSSPHDPLDPNILREQVLDFIDKHSNAKDFQLTTHDFIAVQHVVLSIYEAGSFDMGLWLEFKKHRHLKEFILEQFPPLDFMHTFGQAMMEDYLQTASSAGQKAYAQGLIAAGHVAHGTPWKNVFPLLVPARTLSPHIHPLIQCRNLGLWLHALQTTGIDNTALQRIRALVRQALEEGESIWPVWCHQQCYTVINLSDWVVLAEDTELAALCIQRLRTFRATQDHYSRNPILDNLLNVRAAWHHLLLGQREDALQMMDRVRWASFRSVETHALSMWYYTAQAVLDLLAPKVALANVTRAAKITSYHALEEALVKRLLPLVQSH